MGLRSQTLAAWIAVALLAAVGLCGTPALAEAPVKKAAEEKASGETGPAAAAALKIEVAPGAATPTPAAAAAEARKLTPENTATRPKPKGFRYSILRDVWVDEVGSTLLYVKKNKKARTNKAVPIPKDRKLLATCIAGGDVKDLKRSAIITVKFDPAGMIRPEIIIAKQSSVETLHGKVLDIGGPKLYVALDDHSKRGFAVDAYKDWDRVVTNGNAQDLKRGTPLTVKFDPSGEKEIVITLDTPGTAPAVGAKAKSDTNGCGCHAAADQEAAIPAGALLLLSACGLLLWRRRTV